MELYKKKGILMDDGDTDEQPSRPRFLEAYPCFNLVEGKAAAEQEREVCEFADVRGRVHGLARFGQITNDHVVLKYDIAMPGLPPATGSIELDLVRTPNGVDRNRTITHCPQCKERRIVLVFLNEWACPKCHKLMYRSQAINKDNMVFEKWNALNARISRGRPKGMHTPTFKKLRLELSRLAKRKKVLGVDFPHSQNDFVITSIWKTSAPHHALFSLNH